MTKAAPWGTFPENGLLTAIRRTTGALPMNWLGKRLAFALRRIGLARIDQQVDVVLFNQRVRLYPFDNICEKRVLFTPQMFDAEERAFLSDIAGSGFTFLDIGANVGLYSLWVSSLCDDTAKIVAVEPDPVNFSRLAFNITASDRRNVATEQCAIAATAGRVSLEINPDNRGENRLGDATDGNRGQMVEVDALTLADLFDYHDIDQPDAIKIDVEGHEYDILDSFFTTAPAHRFPRHLIMESIHDGEEKNAVRLALANGYKVHKATRMNVILSLG